MSASTAEAGAKAAGTGTGEGAVAGAGTVATAGTPEGAVAGAGVDVVAAFEGRMAHVIGAARTGKTEALVRRCAALLTRGAEPESIMAVTSTAISASAFRRRLAEAACALDAQAEERAARVCVTTAQNACLAVLDSAGARAFTGRSTRTLANFEYNFFLEDMKTLGLAPRRLRALMRRLQKQWCALAPESEWLLPGEEQRTLDFALDTLRSLDAMLPDEAAWLCATYLKSEEGRKDAQQFAYVLCDDFQNLSHAQQTSLCLMAREQLIVAGNVGETTACATAFPHPQGFSSFAALRRGVATFTLGSAWGNPQVTAFADALAAHDEDAAPTALERCGGSKAITYVKWSTPEEEIEGLAKYIDALVAASDLPESSFAVVAPNKRWARSMAAALRARGLTVSTAGFAGLSGDPRDLQRSRALQAYTLLNLMAKPDDVAAWRCWCGFGNYLTNSDAWSELRIWAAHEGLELLDALARASKLHANGDKEPFLRAWALVKRWDAAQHAIAHDGARRGFALLRALGADDLPEFASIADALAGDEDAHAVYALARRAETAPDFPADPHTLHITSYAALTGCSYAHVIACGCVDGLMPMRNAFEVVSTDEERTRIMNSERRAFSAGVAKAEHTLVLSTFSKASLETAETAKMQVARVRSENGERMAALRPTCFIAEAASAAPSTSGGQALLSELGIN